MKTSSLLAIAFALGTADLGAQVRINLTAYREPVLLDTLRQSQDVSAPAPKVYEAVLKAFAELGIPTGRTDGKAGIVGSERFERANTFVGAPLSRSYACGEGPTGPYADALRLEIAVVAWVAPEGQRTLLGVATIASGRDVSGVFRAARPCVSTGDLESKVMARVNKILAG